MSKVYTILDRRVRLVNDRDKPANGGHGCMSCVFFGDGGCEVTSTQEQRAGVPEPCYINEHHYEPAE